MNQHFCFRISNEQTFRLQTDFLCLFTNPPEGHEVNHQTFLQSNFCLQTNHLFPHPKIQTPKKLKFQTQKKKTNSNSPFPNNELKFQTKNKQLNPEGSFITEKKPIVKQIQPINTLNLSTPLIIQHWI